MMKLLLSATLVALALAEAEPEAAADPYMVYSGYNGYTGVNGYQGYNGYPVNYGYAGLTPYHHAGVVQPVAAKAVVQTTAAVKPLVPYQHLGYPTTYQGVPVVTTGVKSVVNSPLVYGHGLKSVVNSPVVYGHGVPVANTPLVYGHPFRSLSHGRKKREAVAEAQLVYGGYNGYNGYPFNYGYFGQNAGHHHAGHHHASVVALVAPKEMVSIGQ